MGGAAHGVLAGPKGVGKTSALLDLGVSVALGAPWFGRSETEQARVLVLTSEDPEPRLWQRIDAIARAQRRDPGELEGEMFVHPIPLNAITDAPRLEAELGVVQPGLVLLDLAYKYLVGAKASSLFDMGAALTRCRRCAPKPARRCSSDTTTTASRDEPARSGSRVRDCWSGPEWSSWLTGCPDAVRARWCT